MSKTVFFDIDGTIWDDDMVIPESTLEAVAALKHYRHFTLRKHPYDLLYHICAQVIFVYYFAIHFNIVATCRNYSIKTHI